MAGSVYLTKSRYASGLQCLLRLWLDVHAPRERGPAEPGSAADAGLEIGRMAHRLFPGGVLVEDAPWEHAAALARTAALMADRAVPAIFEAAFEHAGVRVRVDVVERLSRGTWGIREVKGTGGVKDHHLDDVAVQLHVVENSGVGISSVEVVHVNKDYARGPEGISWQDLFRRVDVLAAARDRLDGLEARVRSQLACLSGAEPPAVEPEAHCHSPRACPHWDRCTAAKPDDWIFHLPRLGPDRRSALRRLGVESISAIPDDFPLSPAQTVIRDATRTGTPFVATELAQRLEGSGPPADYLDFETVSPAVPLYPGTRPFQTIPFQWSLHRIDDDGALGHQEFLAEGDIDPRRRFAETLVAALDGSNRPVVVYSSYERTQLAGLAAHLPDLATPIAAIAARLSDLLPIVRACVYHPGFAFSHSIKTVAPALCPDVTYDDLGDVADGASAATAFWSIASGRVDATTAARLRHALLAYCRRDTWAMVRLHQGLRRLAGA